MTIQQYLNQAQKHFDNFDAALPKLDANLTQAELAEMQMIGAQVEFTSLVQRVLDEVERVHGQQFDVEEIVKALSCK